MRIILLGTPGGGKGTQAKLICEHYGIPHISTGDIFRKKIKEGTTEGKEISAYMEKGQLVPDRLTIGLVDERLKKGDSMKGFLLDGFPRDEKQAKALDQIMKTKNEQINFVFLIDVPKEIIVERIMGRRVCPKCGESYHIKYNPPKVVGKCDVCGTPLIHRADDQEEIILDRLAIYNRTTEPILQFYKNKGILHKIKGDGGIQDIFLQIITILDGEK
ncbi:adenylate kinase [Acetobacterium wieringae]|uniref:adenylate kinase n=1 Tax=Acetobacterium wieringae TaxID=52694 RepID=UPI0026EA3D42|nr:adenylate kinase [Acetobacterium wieringae]